MEDCIDRLDALINNIQENVLATNSALEARVQEELAKLLSVARRVKGLISAARIKNQKVKQSYAEAIAPNLETAFYALQGTPNTILAKRLRRDAEIEVRRLENPVAAFFVNRIYFFLYATPTPTKVIVGLFLALPIHLAAPIILAKMLVAANGYLKPILAEEAAEIATSPSPSTQPSISARTRLSQYEFNEASALLILSAMAGATGSVVSILTRINEYRNEEYRDTMLPVFIGAFKPAIGGFFGIFIFALVSSTLLPISISINETKPASKWFTFLAIAFVVGFSERFANDIVSQAERIVPREATLDRSDPPAQLGSGAIAPTDSKPTEQNGADSSGTGI